MSAPAMPASLVIVADAPEHYADFARLNRKWIEQFFEMEAADVAALENPQEKILNKGGTILIAVVDGVVAGCVALIPESPGTLELAKMAVDPAFQGQKIGNALMQAAIDAARHRNARELVLETNSSLKPAIHLYEKYGFKHIALENTPYARANVRMSLALNA